MKLGINKALKLINKMNFGEIYDNRIPDLQTIFDIEDFDFEWLVNYLSNLEIPYSVLEDFFDGTITFADLNNKPYNDEWDYLVIDNEGIYCWTEVCGNCFHLKDYEIRWKEYVKPPLTEEEKLEEERKIKEFEKLFSEQLKKLYDETLPKLVADDSVEVKPMTPFKDFVKKETNKK